MNNYTVFKPIDFENLNELDKKFKLSEEMGVDLIAVDSFDLSKIKSSINTVKGSFRGKVKSLLKSDFQYNKEVIVTLKIFLSNYKKTYHRIFGNLWIANGNYNLGRPFEHLSDDNCQVYISEVKSSDNNKSLTSKEIQLILEDIFSTYEIDGLEINDDNSFVFNKYAKLNRHATLIQELSLSNIKKKIIVC